MEADPKYSRGKGFEGLAAADRALVLAASAFVGVLQAEAEDEGVILTEALRNEMIEWLTVYSPDAEWPGKARRRKESG